MPPGPEDLTIVQQPGTTTVDLDWSIPAGTNYDKIRVLRDGAVLAEIGGGDTSYADDVSSIIDPPDYATATWEVRGFISSAFGSTSEAELAILIL